MGGTKNLFSSSFLVILRELGLCKVNPTAVDGFRSSVLQCYQLSRGEIALIIVWELNSKERFTPELLCH